MKKRKHKAMTWAARQVEIHLKLAAELEAWGVKHGSTNHMKAAERHLMMALVLDKWQTQ